MAESPGKSPGTRVRGYQKPRGAQRSAEKVGDALRTYFRGHFGVEIEFWINNIFGLGLSNTKCILVDIFLSSEFYFSPPNGPQKPSFKIFVWKKTPTLLPCSRLIECVPVFFRWLDSLYGSHLLSTSLYTYRFLLAPYPHSLQYTRALRDFQSFLNRQVGDWGVLGREGAGCTAVSANLALWGMC